MPMSIYLCELQQLFTAKNQQYAVLRTQSIKTSRSIPEPKARPSLDHNRHSHQQNSLCSLGYMPTAPVPN
jgi:hypothetical protein